MFEQDEVRLLAEVREAILQRSGQVVRGWMGPWMSHSARTPDLLHEAGFKFLMDWPADDQPVWMKTRAGRILSVPYPFEINDSPQMLVRHHTPQEFEQMVIDQFEEIFTNGQASPAQARCKVLGDSRRRCAISATPSCGSASLERTSALICAR